MKPELWQMILMLATGLIFAAAFLLGLRRLRPIPAGMDTGAAGGGAEQPVVASRRLGPTVRTCFIVGLLLLLTLAAVRWVAFIGQIQATVATAPATAPNAVYKPPLTFGVFDYFVLLGLLLAVLAAYFRLTQHLRWLGFFLLPMVAMVLFLGLVMSALDTQTFNAHSWLNMIHLTSVMIGVLSFAAACVGGIMYLLADRQLRQHRVTKPRWRWPALGQIEKFVQHVTYLGFPLLTIAMISGAMRAHQIQVDQHLAINTEWLASPKILLSIAAWLVYAVLLHVPLAPAFRGRRAAWLSIIGFALLLSVFVAVRWFSLA
ncbi:MAG: cytochrome c biogenesis protein CcsA [Phycisphaerae bacterium]